MESVPGTVVFRSDLHRCGGRVSPLLVVGTMSIVGSAPITDHESWVKEGRCREIGPLDEVFFPDAYKRGKEAKSICATCPVVAQCLAFALRNDERHGIWGGTTSQEREMIRRNTRQRQQFHSAICACGVCARRRPA